MIDRCLPQDYLDLLREFIEADVEFLLIGGWAVAIHGHGRSTDDMDVFVRASDENAARILVALERYGAPLSAHGVTRDLFTQERYGYRMGRKPLLIEVLTKIDGVSFEEAAHDAIEVELVGMRIRVIGKDALLKNKRASGRAKDVTSMERSRAE